MDLAPLADTFEKMPDAVVALLLGAFALWFIGVYFISARSIKREGRSVWQVFNPFTHATLNRQDWLLLLVLAVLCLSGAAFAINWLAWW
ncbi:MAG: hypothetical protein KJ852_02995 [Gammaproteobacteria bacterium]|nr:hypothetical protein [Gammaproteobacteria bacterium]MBU0787550.1 hypothetical protein [Gammaproteobacteria bacterium]MBU0814980.1 hypothetical protein [Gammaproteobacteria bacterium]MBU1785912.1 hypothetical protein [Gammaproteobacteria bacterium]